VGLKIYIPDYAGSATSDITVTIVANIEGVGSVGSVGSGERGSRGAWEHGSRGAAREELKVGKSRLKNLPLPPCPPAHKGRFFTSWLRQDLEDKEGK